MMLLVVVAPRCFRHVLRILFAAAACSGSVSSSRVRGGMITILLARLLPPARRPGSSLSPPAAALPGGHTDGTLVTTGVALVAVVVRHQLCSPVEGNCIYHAPHCAFPSTGKLTPDSRRCRRLGRRQSSPRLRCRWLRRPPSPALRAPKPPPSPAARKAAGTGPT